MPQTGIPFGAPNRFERTNERTREREREREEKRERREEREREKKRELKSRNRVLFVETDGRTAVRFRSASASAKRLIRDL